jgi:hypothetical protein
MICSSGISLSQEKPELWHSGAMHSKEVKGKTGETWLAFCHNSKGFELITTKITVNKNPQKDALMDTYVSVDCLDSCIFLIRGIPELKIGSINTIYNGTTHLKPSQSITLQLAQNINATYSILASGIDKDNRIQNYQLQLFSNQKKQTLVNRAADYDQTIRLLWAGDLDGDGKLDLLIDLSDHYNVREPTLFLSSKAKQGEFVKRYIFYRSTGC